MVMHWLATETSESLDRLYFCKSCGRAFLFRTDKDDHSMQTGHRVFIIFTLEGKLFESQ
jgi:hypothetical protein